MNKCILTGRITKDLELRKTNNDKSVCNFTIAVNERATEDVDFIDCEVWGKAAENLCEYQSKGNMIAVFGRLKRRDYEDKDGVKRTKNYVIADDVEFLEKKKPDTAANNKVEVNPFEDFGKSIAIDENDIPF
jgi:single-strand DNA-binding protein